MQRYALLVGPSPHSLVTLLVVILVGAGVGSRVSQWVPSGVVFLIIVGWVMGDVCAFP
jgi:hypothetical protein